MAEEPPPPPLLARTLSAISAFAEAWLPRMWSGGGSALSPTNEKYVETDDENDFGVDTLAATTLPPAGATKRARPGSPPSLGIPPNEGGKQRKRKQKRQRRYSSNSQQQDVEGQEGGGGGQQGRSSVDDPDAGSAGGVDGGGAAGAGAVSSDGAVEDTKGPKTSEYNVTPVPDPDSLQLTLSMTLGIKGHVIKERWLYVEWNQLATCPAGLLFTVEILQGHAASHPCSILLSGWQLGSHLPPPFIRALSHVCW